MIRWKDGKVDREAAFKEYGIWSPVLQDAFDALDECVAALRLIVNTEDDGSWPHEYATQALRKIGAEP